MRVRFLTIIALCIFLSLAAFAIFIHSTNLEPESHADMGGDAVDPDPDPSPGYGADFAGSLLSFNSIFVAGPIFLGIVSLVFIVSNIILQIKKIPTRKYMLVIAAGVLIFLGGPWMLSGIESLLVIEQLEHENYRILLVGALVQFGIGAVFITPGVVALKKARLGIRR